MATTKLPEAPEDFLLTSWDKGVFGFELLKLSIVATTEPTIQQIEKNVEKEFAEQADLAVETVEEDTEDTDVAPSERPADPYDQGVVTGTVEGTKMAITEMFNLIETRYNSFFDLMGTETIMPQAYTLEKKQQLYQWEPKGNYPPHLKTVPKSDSHSAFEIFNVGALLDVQLLVPRLIPTNFVERVAYAAADHIRFDVKNVTPKGYGAKNLEDLFKYNKDLRKAKAQAYELENIGDYRDWYSDHMFAQQSFSGTNPTTLTVITAAPPSKGQTVSLLDEFIAAADVQKKANVSKLLKSTNASSLYVQDCRYFREAMGLPATAELKSNRNARYEDQWRYSGAPVTLFHLTDSGKLHPIAIVIDYKGSMKNSVVIFNKRLNPAPTNEPAHGEEHDWAWRYAKTVSQCADWLRHEAAIHLTHTHLVEEAIIVATQRTFEWDHIITRILFPHWYRTLSLNAAARDTLVPSVILDIGAVPEQEGYNFINYSYENFDFKNLYVPDDLKKRGFSPDELNQPKFKNYAYAKNIYPVWNIIHEFVHEMIVLYYPKDSTVKNSQKIKNWCEELRAADKGNLKGFPQTISTINELVDAITMCIHIASPQHTAVNYLQQYYQSFIPNKPAALSQPLPTRLSDLEKYTEKNLFDALPVQREREWLLSSHLPYLLSFRIKENQSLVSYSASLYQLYQKKTEEEEKNSGKIREAAARLYVALREFDNQHPIISTDMDDNRYPYTVLDPDNTAVSIMI